MIAAAVDGERSTADAAANPDASRSPTGVAITNPVVRRIQEHARRRQGVQTEEPGGDEEGEADQEDARIAAPARRFTRREREDDADDGNGEHEPEVARLMPPLEVRLRVADQDGEAHERKREQRGDEQHAGTSVLVRGTSGPATKIAAWVCAYSPPRWCW